MPESGGTMPESTMINDLKLFCDTTSERIEHKACELLHIGRWADARELMFLLMKYFVEARVL